MSAGLINYLKELIDNWVGLLVRSEVKKQVSNRMDEVEIKLMKFVEKTVATTQRRERMLDKIKTDSESPNKKGKAGSSMSHRSRLSSPKSPPRKSSYKAPLSDKTFSSPRLKQDSARLILQSN